MEEIVIILLGLIFGSFLNVIIFRLPLGESIVKPRSYCPGCRKQVKAYDNIPVISYIILGGKCRNCKTGISIQYPFVEALSGFTFWFTWHNFSYSPVYAVFSIIFLLILIVLAFIDLKHMILPDELTIGGGILFFIYSFFNPFVSALEAILSGLFVSLMFLGIYFFYLKVRNIEGLGQGDIKMVFMLGVFLGAQKLIVAILLASVSGLLVGIIMILFHNKNLKHALPFGVFLGIGGYISYFWGDLIFNKIQILYL
ncbi:MAG: prepilin peptidase [Acidobacteriota bacterium]